MMTRSVAAANPIEHSVPVVSHCHLVEGVVTTMVRQLNKGIRRAFPDAGPHVLNTCLEHLAFDLRIRKLHVARENKALISECEGCDEALEIDGATICRNGIGDAAFDERAVSVCDRCS